MFAILSIKDAILKCNFEFKNNKKSEVRKMDDVKDLRTFSLDIEKGTLVVNGEEIKKVTAFTLEYYTGCIF